MSSDSQETLEIQTQHGKLRVHIALESDEVPTNQSLESQSSPSNEPQNEEQRFHYQDFTSSERVKELEEEETGSASPKSPEASPQADSEQDLENSNQDEAKETPPESPVAQTTSDSSDNQVQPSPSPPPHIEGGPLLVQGREDMEIDA